MTLINKSIELIKVNVIDYLGIKLSNTFEYKTTLVCLCVCVLRGEAEEDVDDDGCQFNALFPVLPQYSGQSTQSRLCVHTHS